MKNDWVMTISVISIWKNRSSSSRSSSSRKVKNIGSCHLKKMTAGPIALNGHDFFHFKSSSFLWWSLMIFNDFTEEKYNSSCFRCFVYRFLILLQYNFTMRIFFRFSSNASFFLSFCSMLLFKLYYEREDCFAWGSLRDFKW